MDPLNFSDERAIYILNAHKFTPSHICLSCMHLPEDISGTFQPPKEHSCKWAQSMHDLKYWACYSQNKTLCAEWKTNKEKNAWALILEQGNDTNTLFLQKREQNKVVGNINIVEKCNEYSPLPDNHKYFIYLQSDAWRKRAKKAKERAGYRCQICGSAENLQTHHVTYDRLGAEDEDDLIAVCKKCHERIHSGRYSLIDKRLSKLNHRRPSEFY